MLDRLVGRTIFAQADGVVSQHKNAALFHNGRHAQGVAGVIGEHQEGAAVGDKAAVQSHAIHDGRHAKFTHTVGNIVGTGLAG